MILDTSILPLDLGLPPRFTSFRQAQIEIADWAIYGASETIGPKPFMLVGAPPGIGKSLVAQLIGRMSGVKYAVLTATRALEDQAAGDFGQSGLVNIRGRANYTCRNPKIETDDQGRVVSSTAQTCEEGADGGCEYAGTDRCEYSCRYGEAKEDRAVLTNYQYWFHVRQYGGALETEDDPIKLLICDEFHLAYSALASFLGVWVSDRDLHQFAGAEIRSLLRAGGGAVWGRVNTDWVEALEAVSGRLSVRLGEIKERYGGVEAAARRKSREFRHLARVMSNLDRVIEHGRDNNWIWRQTSNPRAGLSFDCIWPGRYAKRYLWSGVERVVGMSATLRPKHAQLTGLGSTQYSFREWPRQFDARLNPVYWVPTGKMGRDETIEEKLKAVKAHDRIIEAGWGEYKGLAHTGSYPRTEWLKQNSKYGGRMIAPTQGARGGEGPDRLTAGEALRKHLESPEPTTLIGPVYHTGWDMPDEVCRWIHWLKLPFPDRSDPVVVARAESDPDWYSCETAQAFVQGNGRGVRHEGDWCTVIVTDDSIKGFRNYARQFFPGWSRVLDAPGGKIPGPPRRPTSK